LSDFYQKFNPDCPMVTTGTVVAVDGLIAFFTGLFIAGVP